MKNFIKVLSAGCFMVLLSGVNASATTVAFGNDGTPHSLELREVESDFWGLTGYDSPDGYVLNWEVIGTKLTYNIYNNSTYHINAFAVGVDPLAGSTADNIESAAGWSAGVITVNSSWGLDASYWNNQLNGYNYAYYAQVYAGFGEPGNSDYAPAGDPLGAFEQINDEFSFTFDNGFSSSPVMFFATDANGNEFIISGESSHSSGENPIYVADGTAPVPVPTTILLLSTGLAGLAGWRKKRNK